MASRRDVRNGMYATISAMVGAPADIAIDSARAGAANRAAGSSD